MANELAAVLNDAKSVINSGELEKKLNKVISSSSDMTWLDLANSAIPVVVTSIENGKVELTGSQKSKLASDIILPLIKDKLPWYIKPIAGTLVKTLIDIVIGILNKLFTHDWGKTVKDLLGKKKSTKN